MNQIATTQNACHAVLQNAKDECDVSVKGCNILAVDTAPMMVVQGTSSSSSDSFLILHGSYTPQAQQGKEEEQKIEGEGEARDRMFARFSVPS